MNLADKNDHIAVAHAALKGDERVVRVVDLRQYGRSVGTAGYGVGGAGSVPGVDGGGIAARPQIRGEGVGSCDKLASSVEIDATHRGRRWRGCALRLVRKRSGCL